MDKKIIPTSQCCLLINLKTYEGLLSVYIWGLKKNVFVSCTSTTKNLDRIPE